MLLCILRSPGYANGRLFSASMTAGENETKTVFAHDTIVSSRGYQLHYYKNLLVAEFSVQVVQRLPLRRSLFAL